MKYYMMSAVMLLCLAGLSLADEKGSDKKDKAALQGTWKATKGGLVKQLKFTGNKFELTFEETVVFTGTFTTNSGKKPKWIDMKIEKGPRDAFNGKTAVGIYKLEGNTLTWCANEPGKDKRPEKFAAKQDDGQMLLVTFKKEKKK